MKRLIIHDVLSLAVITGFTLMFRGYSLAATDMSGMTVIRTGPTIEARSSNRSRSHLQRHRIYKQPWRAFSYHRYADHDAADGYQKDRIVLTEPDLKWKAKLPA